MKKTILMLVAMLLLLVTVGCFEVDEVKSIQFVDSPEASYFVGDTEEADQFELLIITSSTSIRYNLTSSEVVVQGLNGTILDTREPGTKTIKVTYKTVTMTYTYEVLQRNITGWQQDVANTADLVEEATGGYLIDNATELAVFAKMVNAGNTFAGKTVTLNADIDLQNKPWTPIGTEPVYTKEFHPFSGTFDGNDKKVSNLKVVNTASHDNCNAGLFGLVNGAAISDLILDNVSISVTSSFKEEYSKNFAALLGRSTGAVTIDNVEVTNATVRGNGRVGGILGMSNGLVNITNCKVTANISAYNCIFLAGNDGEGDKVGGLAGQLQGESVTIANVISNNTVNVFVNGTRDVGGLVGYAVSTTFTSNIVLATSSIEVTATGGFVQSKGTCNAGGIVGTLGPEQAGKLQSFTFTTNTVSTTNIVAESADSSHGILFGGVRRSTWAVSVNGSLYNVASGADFAAFKTLQSAIVVNFE